MDALTIFGFVAVTLMLVFYALEARSSGYLACVVLDPNAGADAGRHLLDLAAGLCEARRCPPRFAGSWHIARVACLA